MEIRTLTEQDIPAAKQLWMDAFGDSGAFVRFYFEKKFDLKNSLGAFDEGDLAGDLTMQEMTVRLRCAELKTGFLAGCATRSDYRNRGIMRTLLHAQMEKMNEEGYALCHLHPFLHAFYRKFGWETVSFMNERSLRLPLPEKPLHENDFSTDALLEKYRCFMASAEGCFLRSGREMEIRVGEHVNDGGKVLCKEEGYALYFVSQTELEVIELVWIKGRPGEVIAPLGTYGLPVRFNVPDYYTGGAEGKTIEYTMMRVVNAKRLFENLHFPGAYFSVCVRDDFCEWNNVSLLVDCREGKTRICETQTADFEVDVRTLSQLVAGKTPENAGKLKEIFTGQKTCFFNTY